ncbi:haloacid dehalogenase [Nitrospira sp.]|nr:haloacid dehalogenase [Nitrospira sp.]
MLRAILFDFDGVIADTEPLHFRGFQQILSDIDIPLTEADYYARYLGFDDRGAFTEALRSSGRAAPSDAITELVKKKASVYLQTVRDHIRIFPGVEPFVRLAASRFPLAIVSGALRGEIELILDVAGFRPCFRHITSAEDVTQGKPHPQGFRLALDALNRTTHSTPITASECLVIEDSLPGIRGARAAGMKVLAVANTHTIQELGEADAIAYSLADVTLDEIQRRLWRSAPDVEPS